MVDDHPFQPKTKIQHLVTLGTVAQSEVLPKQFTIQGYWNKHSEAILQENWVYSNRQRQEDVMLPDYVSSATTLLCHSDEHGDVLLRRCEMTSD